MVMAYATVTGRIVVPGTTTGIPGELHATPLTAGGVLAFPTEDYTTVGPAVATVTGDGTLSPSLKIPTDVPDGTLWRLTFVPKGKGKLPVRLGDYAITTSTDIADLVPVQVMAITPTVAFDISAAATRAAAAAASAAAAAASAAEAEALIISDLGTTDGQTRALIEAPASQTAKALTATIAPGAVLDGSRTVVIGDSLTRAADATNVQSFRGSWFTWASLLTGGNLRLFKNQAWASENSAQLKARFDTEVLPLAPTLALLMLGRNDTPNGSGYPTPLIDYLTYVVPKLRAIGCGVVLVNTVPQGNAALPTPTGLTAELFSSGGGSVTPGVHRFKISALTGGTSVLGETLASAPVAFTTSGTTSRIKLSWPEVPGATGYRIYKETSDGSGVYQLRQQIIAGGSSPSVAPHHYYVQSNGTLSTAEPGANTTAQPISMQGPRARINAFLAQYAAANGIPLVDAYGLLVDPLTGMYQAGKTWDGTHPTLRANREIGQAVADKIGPLLRPLAPVLATSAADPVNLDTNGLFATGDAAKPTGWTVAASLADTTGTSTRGARAGFKGNALVITNAAATETTAVGPNIATGFTVGDRLLVSFVVEATTDTGAGWGYVRLHTQGGSQVTELLIGQGNLAPRPYAVEVTVPSGTTSLHWEALLNGVGSLAFGQMTLYNLTTETYLPTV